MRAIITRNKETGEFACMLGSCTLAKGKSGRAVAGVHDACEAVNMAIECGLGPVVSHNGKRGAERRFAVVWGDAVIADGMSATGAYRILDGIEAEIEKLSPVGTESLIEPEGDDSHRSGVDTGEHLAGHPITEGGGLP